MNLLTKFLFSFQIHKGPTSDIGTLMKFDNYKNTNGKAREYASVTPITATRSRGPQLQGVHPLVKMKFKDFSGTFKALFQ